MPKIPKVVSLARYSRFGILQAGCLIPLPLVPKDIPPPQFSQAGGPANNRSIIDRLNKEMGVMQEQEEAMLAGLLFGWHTKAADSRSYDKNGQPQRTKKRNELRQ